jgi:RNA ligase (TIGR02306 family)
VWEHPNANRLELASLKGLSFQFVVGKGTYQPGDNVIYFPVDSVLPKDVLIKTGFEGKLSGQGKDRVKTVRLREQISQGLVVKPDVLLQGYEGTYASEELTSYLGVTKYDPPVVVSTHGTLLPLPEGLGKYDIEGADRFPVMTELLLDQPVFESEKLEGTNVSVARIGGKIFVNQRNFTIEEIPGKENLYWSVARAQNLIDKLSHFEGDVAIYGELCGAGVQSNIYHLKGTKIYAFDIKVNGRWLPPSEFLETCAKLDIPTVPVISVGRTLRETLNGATIQSYSNGNSILADRGIKDVMREGIVIKPLKEQFITNFGRLFIKQRSPAYLAKSDN